MLVACPALGQDILKSPLTPDNYPEFGTLWPQKISDKGNWVSFAMQYDSGKDTLFVRHINAKSGYSYPGGRNGRFNGDGIFLCQVADTLVVHDLAKGTRRIIKGVIKYDITRSGRYLLVFQKGQDGSDVLSLRDAYGGPVKEYGKVTAMQFNEAGDRMVYCLGEGAGFSIRIANLEKDPDGGETIIAGSPVRFSYPVWKKETIAFTTGETTPVLYCYNSRNKTLKQCPYNNEKADMAISDQYGALYISEDQQQVFFHLVEKKPVKENADVQVWNSLDRQIYPNKQRYGDAKLVNKIAVWQLAEDRTEQLTDRQFQFQTLNGNAGQLISITDTDSLSLNLQHNDHDVYVTDIATGNRKMILSRHSGNMLSIIASPGGRYIAYPSQKNWWVYDLVEGEHKNMTGTLPFPLYDETHTRPSFPGMYGMAGWLDDDKTMLVYDKYDIWKVSTRGTPPVRLTNGREKGCSYRFVRGESESAGNSFISALARTFSLEKGVLLQVTDLKELTTGYSLLRRDKEIVAIVKPERKASHLYKAALVDTYMFMEQDFDMPRRLMSVTLPGGKKKNVFQSNPQRDKYPWGRSEKISFSVKGNKLEGALYYPANFSKDKKYPMIVQVYERQSPYVHEFTNPTYFEQGGFNISNYTLNGYFVLLPDIAYEYGATGRSATESVIAAVDTVLNMGYVLRDKIGLIGHSFGGYETDIIITNTDRFAAAVSGSAWADLVSGYFHVGENTMTVDFWRYEQDQLRLGVSPYDDIVPYIENSPVLKASSVTTPLLSWVGLHDETIDPKQSIEFYLALRRLGKTNTMLVYPEEYHMLLDPPNQKDLSLRVEQWFGHYLKDEAPRPWMMPN